jgi:hypothetical protein
VLAGFSVEALQRAYAAGRSTREAAWKFPKALAEMVTCDADVVSWNATARTLVIVDQERFKSDVMPRYSNGSFHCFQRQLQYHGFYTAKSAAGASWPQGARVYVNRDTSIRAVADFERLVKRKAGAARLAAAPAPAPKPLSRAERAARRAGLAPAAPMQVDDDDDDAAPWSGPATESDGWEAPPPQDAPVAVPPALQPVGAYAAPPVGMGATPPVGAVAMPPFDMGPFGGALQPLDVVEVAASREASALDDEALAARAWETPPLPPPLDDCALESVLADLDAQSPAPDALAAADAAARAHLLAAAAAGRVDVEALIRELRAMQQ